MTPERAQQIRMASAEGSDKDFEVEWEDADTKDKTPVEAIEAVNGKRKASLISDDGDDDDDDSSAASAASAQPKPQFGG